MSQLSAIKSIKTHTLNSFINATKEDANAQLFVVNRSNPRNQLALSVLMDNNQPDVVMVPANWLPYELTLRAQLPNILKSATFKRALNCGDLVIADTESVCELFRNNKRARQDYLAAHGHDWVDPSDEQGSLLDLTADADDAADRNRERDNSSGDPANTRYSDNDLVNDLIIQSRAGSDATSITTAILNSADTLTTDDLLCIANNVTDSEVKDFCMSSAD